MEIASSGRAPSSQRHPLILFLHPCQTCFGCLYFTCIGDNVVSSDEQMILIQQCNFCAPAPVWSAGGIRIMTKHEESVFCRFAHTEHNGCVVVKRVHPTGFVLISRCVIAKGEHSILWLAFNGALVKVKREAPIKDKLDTSGDGRFVCKRIRLKPEPRYACPVACKFCQRVMRTA